MRLRTRHRSDGDCRHERLRRRVARAFGRTKDWRDRLARRFRHRLLEPCVPHTAACRSHQDRQVVVRGSPLRKPANRHAMVEAMVALARALGMGTVAEGIETETQLGLVKELGCDVVQGHFIGRPAPAARIEPFAETRFGPAPAASSSSQDARSGPRWRSTRSRPVRLASAASDELESTPRALKRAKSQHLIPPGDALHPGRVNQAFSGDDASIRSSLSVSRACG